MFRSLVRRKTGCAFPLLGREEERGTLELLLYQPVTRRRVAVAKLLSTTTEVALLAAVLALRARGRGRIFGVDVSAWNLLAASISAGALALTFGAIAFFIGAATGRKAVALGLAAAAAVAAYLVNALGSLVSAFEPLQKLSPFYHYAASDPLRQGLAVSHLLFLLTVAVIAAAAGILAFDRRDIRSA